MVFIFSLALEDVDLNKVYVLGGLVDESIQKVSVHFRPKKLYFEKWCLLLEAPTLLQFYSKGLKTQEIGRRSLFCLGWPFRL